MPRLRLTRRSVDVDAGADAVRPESGRRTPARLVARLPERSLSYAGPALTLLIAVGLFTRFSINSSLTPDESIYSYGAQQFAQGIPFYVSIFDPKGPLAPMLAGAGVAAARALGQDDLHAIRLVFFVLSCLTVVAVYALNLRLWRSRVAGVVGAVTFASFSGFAVDALTGPNAKTPGILFAVVAMTLLVERRWMWGAFAGSLAFLTWQPLGVYAAVAVGRAPLAAGRPRWKPAALAVGATAIPIVAIGLYFWRAGGLAEAVDAALRYPLVGLKRRPETLGERLGDIARVAHASYAHTWVLLWAGLAMLVWLVIMRLVEHRAEPRRLVSDPLVMIIAPTFIALTAFSAHDFQGYADLYPALPYAAIGVAGGVASALRRVRALRRAAVAVSLAAAAILVGLCWNWYSQPTPIPLAAQRARADAVARTLGADDELYVLGSPVPLVLTGRRNPSRYIYLRGGADRWLLRHTPRGMQGWKERIRAWDPAIVVIAGTWHGRYRRTMTDWLRESYDEATLGRWRLFLHPRLRARATHEGIRLLPDARDERQAAVSSRSGSQRNVMKEGLTSAPTRCSSSTTNRHPVIASTAATRSAPPRPCKKRRNA